MIEQAGTLKAAEIRVETDYHQLCIIGEKESVVAFTPPIELVLDLYFQKGEATFRAFNVSDPELETIIDKIGENAQNLKIEDIEPLEKEFDIFGLQKMKLANLTFYPEVIKLSPYVRGRVLLEDETDSIQGGPSG